MKVPPLRAIEFSSSFSQGYIDRHLYSAKASFKDRRVFIVEADDIMLDFPSVRTVIDFGLRENTRVLYNGVNPPLSKKELGPISKREQTLRSLKGAIVYRFYEWASMKEWHPLDLGGHSF